MFHERQGFDDGDAIASERVALAGLILALRTRGIRDRRILSAIELIPRRLFLPVNQHSVAYDDKALPIEYGQLIAQPSMVARIAEALGPDPGWRILEVGTGSGYQAAVLSRLFGQVYTLERYRSLVTLAADRFTTLRLGNAFVRQGDGLEGWAEKAPFDAVVVNGSMPHVPESLIRTLRMGGQMIIAIGPSIGRQKLLRVVRTTAGTEETVLGTVRMVPILHGTADWL